MPQWEDWQQAAINEVSKELSTNCPVRKRFNVASFVSASKGRKRKRNRLKEIILVEDTYEGLERFTLYENLSFDTLATEVYQGSQLDGLELEAKLRKEILQI